MSVLIETTIGDFVVDLYIKERPKTSMNFLKLCKLKYYNFSLFHTIQQNFIAQAGDPTETGRGGESIFCQMYGDQARFFEMEAVPLLNHAKRGCLSMVNNGDNMHGSQFFVTLDEDLKYLNGVHTVFGEITEGFDILEKLNDAICDKDNHPFQDIRIMHTIVLDDPFPDPDGVDFPSRSPSPDERLLESARIGVDEEVDEMKNKPEEEIAELIAAKEARTQAHILEMVGDLHYAEEKPPDNVLFVCKLNAVTTEDDLEVIFGRFGPILSCEVIRDRKTGDSLQYAFIEFADAKHCENAYFKMDNVLIDDRRIHVDFSQSVAKNFQWNRKLGNTCLKENSDGEENNVKQFLSNVKLQIEKIALFCIGYKRKGRVYREVVNRRDIHLKNNPETGLKIIESQKGKKEDLDQDHNLDIQRIFIPAANGDDII
ncbi:Peptidyl-prolyl cis-trans isomerase-like 4 [Trichinella murrelli]|uniref:Peptidyl-prolyl cis-trans isomerase n=1 Tax=Trichinella murrelli TaxID=144512 RepID=A0A0V0TDG9_9BILA|nr:Peptidyl-prolyl cis-trans isomerase-like 4 [Trichinella murrelli]